MKKINYKLILKKFVHWLSKIGSDADGDWKLILVISITLSVGIIFYGVQTFFLVEGQKQQGSTIQAKNTGFVDAKGLKEVLNKYSIRARDFSRLMGTTTPFVDPSR